MYANENILSRSVAMATPGHFWGLFLISLATLMYEILLTRIFSVTMYYHFAFMAVSIALFGMTLGALIVYGYPKNFAPERTSRHLAAYSAYFAYAILGSYIFHIAFPIVFDGGIQQFLSLGATYLIFLIPFSASGICISLALTRFPRQIGKLYAYDLLGASLGALSTIVVITLGGPAAIIFASVLAAAAASLFGRGTYSTKKTWGLILAVSVLFLVVIFLERHGVRPLSPILVKGHAVPEYIYDEWNSFSRVTVDNRGLSYPVGWGFAPTYKNPEKIEQLYIRIDADAGTPITRFDGDLRKVDFLKYDIINLAHYIRQNADELIIGAGGGRDVLSALAFKQRSITAIEINKNILNALNRRFGDFSGHLDAYPHVKFINDEARSWLSRSKEDYDIIQISLIDTWAATTAGAFTLSENSLYTVEGWRVFLEHLSANGVLTVSRWYFEDFPGEVYRLTALADRSLETLGIEDARSHVIVFRSMARGGAGTPDGVGTMLVGKAPFSDTDIATLEKVAKEMGFELVLSPRYAIDPNSEALIKDGRAASAIRSRAGIDVSAPTDDRPFFFNMLKFGDAVTGKISRQGYNTFNLHAVLTLAYLFAIMVILAIAGLIIPGMAASGARVYKENFWFIVFFTMIGFGFMLIEISQMQRFIILLGHPSYSLSITLFSLLFGGGIGSYFAHSVNHSNKRSQTVFILGMLLLALVTIGLVTPWLIRSYEAAGILQRIFASFAAFLPLGFFMGTAFPIGMHLAKIKTAGRDITPWLWGVNGSASVLASVIAVMMSISWGISAAYWAGVSAYCAAALSAFMMLASTPKAPPKPQSFSGYASTQE